MSKDVDLDQVIEGQGQQEAATDADEKFDERGGFDASRQRRHPGMKAFMGLLFLICLGIVAFMFWQRMGGDDEAQDAGNAPDPSTSAVSTYRFPTTPPEDETPEVSDTTASEASAESEPEPESEPFIPTLPSDRERGSRVHPQDAEEPATPEELAMQRRLTNFGQTAQTSAQEMAPDAGQAASGGLLGGGGSGEGKSESHTDFMKSLNSGQVSRAHASHLENPSMTIPQGTTIPCGTTTQLDTTQKGMVGCIVSRDVYSADRRVKLIDKGAQVTGFMGTGIQQGQARVFVAWNRLRNPDNVVINLDSPGVGRLGAAGIEGQVDTHFWERFGGAILVSVIGDMGEAAVQTLGDRASNGNTNINLNNTSSTTNTLANEALKASIDIPPTLFANHGKPVAIYVAKDLDFSDVYGLELK